MMSRIVCALVSAMLVGCEPTFPVAVDDFDRSCDANSECVTLAFGDICDLCTQQFDSIAERDLERYQAEVTTLAEQCADVNDPRDCEGPGDPRIPECIDGQCALPADAALCPAGFPCRGVDGGG